MNTPKHSDLPLDCFGRVIRGPLYKPSGLQEPVAQTSQRDTPRVKFGFNTVNFDAPTQLNSLETYRDAGQKAGQAQRRKDYRLRSFHTNWLSRALALEAQPYRDQAHATFDEAYCIETGVIKHT